MNYHYYIKKMVNYYNIYNNNNKQQNCINKEEI